MDFKLFAPIVIPTLNRYEHLKRCVDSLSKCTHAEETELIIGLDYPPSEKYIDGWKKVCVYVEEITGFKKVTILRADHNLGASNNIRHISEYALKDNDAYIFTEDDNEFSPCFLDYINKALIKYWDNQKVSAICGYSFPVDMSGYIKNVYFHHDQSAWGVARWKHKRTLLPEECLDDLGGSCKKRWKLFWSDSRLFYLLLAMEANHVIWNDAINGIYNILNDQIVLYPTLSMCRNHGLDGSGLHGGISRKDVFLEQEIDSNSFFDIDDLEVKECTNSRLKDYFKMPIKERLVCIKQYLKKRYQK